MAIETAGVHQGARAQRQRENRWGPRWQEKYWMRVSFRKREEDNEPNFCWAQDLRSADSLGTEDKRVRKPTEKIQPGRPSSLEDRRKMNSDS